MRYVAYNKKVKQIVGWLGYTTTKKAMQNRLKRFKTPNHIIPKIKKRRK